MKLRQGKNAPRTLWVQVGARPSETNDKIVGIVDTEELSVRICNASEDTERLRYELQRAVDAFESKNAEFERLTVTAERLRDAIRVVDEEVREIINSMSWGPCQDVMAKHRFELERITEAAVKVKAIA